MADRKRPRSPSSLSLPPPPVIRLPLIIDKELEKLCTLLAAITDGTLAAHALQTAYAAARAGNDAEAGRVATTALNVAWTALHTGHWAQVDSTWRSAYMVAALMVAQAEAFAGNTLSALRTVDLALMLGDYTFRTQLLQAADTLEEARGTLDDQGASTVSTLLAIVPSPHRRRLSGTLPPLQRLRLPSLAYFYNEFMATGTPVVLTGVLDGWPALSSRPWRDIAYLRRVVGHRTVPVEFGAHYLDEGFDEQLMTVAQFIDEHVAVGTLASTASPATTASPPRAYLAQHQLFEQCPRLRRDIVVPDYCQLASDTQESDEGEEVAGSESGHGSTGEDPDSVRINAWFGPAGTLSPLHYDRYHNLFAQVVGTKYVRLYAPEWSESLYAHTTGPHKVSSRIIDPDDVDDAEFPKFSCAPYVDVELNAGELLYIPPQHWHFVEATTVSFSVSFWF